MAKKKLTRRRRRGEGSITQRRDGTWTGYILTNEYHNGRRKRRHASGDSVEDVRRKLAKLQAQSEAGTLTDLSLLTVAQHLNHWLDTAVKGVLRDSTHDIYQRYISKHVIPSIGSLRLTTVSQYTIQKFISELSRESPNTARKCLMLLRAAFAKASTIPQNPCLGVELPRRDRQKEIHPLTKAQADTFISVAETCRLSALYILAILSGARLGEILALDWLDVDLDDGAVSISKTISNVGSKARIDDAKTSASKRRILLPQKAVDAMHDHRKRMLAEGNYGEAVFVTKKGIRLSRGTVRSQFASLLEMGELPTIRFHDLRHTHATLLLLAGENPKIVSERLGHSKISITLDTYSHVIPSMQEQARDKLDRMFGARKTAKCAGKK